MSTIEPPKANEQESLSVDVGNIIMDHEPDLARLVKALTSEDEIGALVRCHYEAEQAINHVLNRMSNGRSGEIEGWQSFANKLEVCRVLGIPDEFCAPLKTLNKHRNTFAHKGRENLAAQEVRDLFLQVKSVYPVFGDEFHFEVVGEAAFNKKYGEASEKERYVMCCAVAINLFSALPQILMGAGTKSQG